MWVGTEASRSARIYSLRLSLCSHLRKVGAIAFFVLSCFHASPIYSRDIGLELKSVFSDLAVDTDRLSQIAGALSSTETIRAEFVNHLRILLSDEKIVSALSAELSSNFYMFEGLDDSGIRTLGADFGAAWFQIKAVEGLKRLPASEQRLFLSYGLEILSRMSVDECASAVVGTAEAMDMVRAEARVLDTMEPLQVQRYLSLSRRALAAEVEGRYSVPLNPTERRIAEMAFGSQLANRIEAHPRSEPLLYAASSMETAPADDVCELGRMILSVALEVPGQAGDWVIMDMNGR